MSQWLKVTYCLNATKMWPSA